VLANVFERLSFLPREVSLWLALQIAFPLVVALGFLVLILLSFAGRLSRFRRWRTALADTAREVREDVLTRRSGAIFCGVWVAWALMSSIVCIADAFTDPWDALVALVLMTAVAIVLVGIDRYRKHRRGTA